MLKNYFKKSVRALLKEMSFTAINIIGLTLGLTCSIMILLWIGDDMSFDRQHKNVDPIYRRLFNIQYPDGSINTWWNAPQPLEAVLMIIALLSVSLQSFKAAIANPVHTLRDE